ncbi:uncharacterized protein DS421_7g222140 [Arachis hypogaea]|nr:uncharacterized protein DS421_7g222140 [Arachis hypogaea]
MTLSSSSMANISAESEFSSMFSMCLNQANARGDASVVDLVFLKFVSLFREGH